MHKIDEIKEAQLVARKARDTFTATLLTTVIGEAEMVGKTIGNRTSTDEEVISVLRKFEKNINENIKIFTDRTMLDECVLAICERDIIQRFLPVKITNLQVQKDIGTLIYNLNLAKEQKSLGIIVKELKTKYGNQFDGQQVSSVFKGMMV